MEYKILEKAENIKDSIIEKTGVPVHFTLAELEQNDASLLKTRKEVQAKHDLEAAKMKNIEENHPFVLTMAPVDLFSAYMYQEAKSFVTACDKKLDEINKQLDDDRVETDEILKQIPELAVAPDAAPAAAPAAAPKATTLVESGPKVDSVPPEKAK